MKTYDRIHGWRIVMAAVYVIGGMVVFWSSSDEPVRQATVRHVAPPAIRGSMDNPFILSSTGRFIFTLSGRNDVKVVKLKPGVGPEWRVIDPGHKVMVRVYNPKTRGWSEWSELTITARKILGRYNRLEFKAPSLDPGETVRIDAIGGPFDHD